jgi:hypothetical protein
MMAALAVAFYSGGEEGKVVLRPIWAEGRLRQGISELHRAAMVDAVGTMSESMREEAEREGDL